MYINVKNLFTIQYCYTMYTRDYQCQQKVLVAVFVHVRIMQIMLYVIHS